MTADWQSLDEQLADEARDRDAILAQLAAAQARHKALRTGWEIVRQVHTGGEVVEHPVSRHRFERLAYWRAYRLARSHQSETGCHYTVRRADA